MKSLHFICAWAGFLSELQQNLTIQKNIHVKLPGNSKMALVVSLGAFLSVLCVIVLHQ